MKSQMHSEPQSHFVSHRRTLHDREIQQEQTTQRLEDQEARLRIQLHAEKPMMTSPKERFLENSENEREAVLSAQQLATARRSEKSRQSTAWASGKTRCIKTYQGGGGVEHEEDGWEEPSHYSSVYLPPSGIDFLQPFTPTEKVDSPFQPLRPAEGNPWEHIPSTSIAFSDTRSVTGVLPSLLDAGLPHTVVLLLRRHSFTADKVGGQGSDEFGQVLHDRFLVGFVCAFCLGCHCGFFSWVVARDSALPSDHMFHSFDCDRYLQGWIHHSGR